VLEGLRRRSPPFLPSQSIPAKRKNLVAMPTPKAVSSVLLDWPVEGLAAKGGTAMANEPREEFSKVAHALLFEISEHGSEIIDVLVALSHKADELEKQYNRLKEEHGDKDPRIKAANAAYLKASKRFSEPLEQAAEAAADVLREMLEKETAEADSAWWARFTGGY